MQSIEDHVVDRARQERERARARLDELRRELPVKKTEASAASIPVESLVGMPADVLSERWARKSALDWAVARLEEEIASLEAELVSIDERERDALRREAENAAWRAARESGLPVYVVQR